MIVGFDGKRAVNNLTGLGNYSRLVIESLGKEFHKRRQGAPGDGSSTGDSRAGHQTGSRSFGMYVSTPTPRPDPDDWRLLVYTPSMRQNSRLEPIRRLDNVEFRFPPAAGFKGALWRSYGITNNIKADGCRLFHGLSNELPLNIRRGGVASVVTIHDLIYKRLPACYTLPDRLLYDFKYGMACRHADRIIAVSERTRSDITELYDINPDRIDVIYQGCSDIFRAEYSTADLEDARRRLQLPKRYIVQVGTIEQRKNLELTVRALSAVPEDIHLVTVGHDHHGYEQRIRRLIAELGLQQRVHLLPKVVFRDLPAVYSLAEVSAYPSRYEGFGIPILESLERGTPVVGATGSCLEEAGGEGGLYVDPDSPREMAEALNSILTDKDLHSRLQAAGKLHAAHFDNSLMASRILDTYEKALDTYNATRPEK